MQIHQFANCLLIVWEVTTRHKAYCFQSQFGPQVQIACVPWCSHFASTFWQSSMTLKPLVQVVVCVSRLIIWDMSLTSDPLVNTCSIPNHLRRRVVFYDAKGKTGSFSPDTKWDQHPASAPFFFNCRRVKLEKPLN